MVEIRSIKTARGALESCKAVTVKGYKPIAQKIRFYLPDTYPV